MYVHYLKTYHAPEGIPILFLNCSGNISYLRGDAPIINHLEETVKNCSTYGITTSHSDGGITNPYNNITIPLILSAALIDSFNPCAFAVMIFLLSYLTRMSNKKRILIVGLTYIFAVYITYYLAGLGIFKSIQSFTQITSIIYNIAAIIAIFAGAVNVKDFLFYDKGFSLRIPKSKKEIISKWAKKATIPSAIILGILVSMFELPCTGGIYLAILSLLAKSAINGYFYLAIYNLVFVFPLFVILSLTYSGTKLKTLNKWKESNKNWMKLISGLFMLLLGIGMILGMI